MNNQQPTLAAKTENDECKSLCKEVLDFKLSPMYSPPSEGKDDNSSLGNLNSSDELNSQYSHRDIEFKAYRVDNRQEEFCLESTQNHVLFMLEGTAQAEMDDESYSLSKDDAIVICHGQEFKFKPECHCCFVTYTFDSFSLPIAEYLDNLYKSLSVYRSSYTPIFRQSNILRSYVENIMFLLDKKDIWASWYVQNKAYEGFHLMTKSYSAGSLLSIFDRLITHNRSFRNVILRYCEKVRSVDELISLTDLSRTKFYKLFNKEFGMSVHRWMQVRRARIVRFDAALPGMTVKYLMERNGFVSASNFIRFCRIYFGCTPLELIHRMSTGRPVPEV